MHPACRLAFKAYTVGFLLMFFAYGQVAKRPPSPPKSDVPFLVHANNLVETEFSEAIEETKKNRVMYYVPDASSAVQTPRARPEFLLLSENLDPERLRLYRFESKNGRREILIRKKKKILTQPYFLSVEAIEPGLFLIRVDDVLDNGEYCLTPDGANDVFCFTVY